MPAYKEARTPLRFCAARMRAVCSAMPRHTVYRFTLFSLNMPDATRLSRHTTALPMRAARRRAFCASRGAIHFYVEALRIRAICRCLFDVARLCRARGASSHARRASVICARCHATALMMISPPSMPLLDIDIYIDMLLRLFLQVCFSRISRCFSWRHNAEAESFDLFLSRA